MSSPRVCLSEQVWRPRFLRAALLALADSNAALFTPVWSTALLDRLALDLLEGGAVSELVARQMISQMRAGWPDSETLPDPGVIAELSQVFRSSTQEAELLATAVAGGADTLVTWNPGDFSDPVCARCNVFSRSPDRFVRGLFRGDPDRIIQLLTRLVAEDAEPISFRVFLGGLASTGLEHFVYDLLGFRSIVELEALTDEWRENLRES